MFFSIKKKKGVLLKEWVDALAVLGVEARSWKVVCSEHFTNDCFEYKLFKGVNTRFIKTDKVPTLKPKK